MKFLSICSGIEAASVAWNPLGWKAVAFSEIEPFPYAVLAHHYPDVPNLGDMTKFEEWPDLEFDLLCGGTPCQAFSVAGKRGGLKDERGNLALDFCRIADRYNPDWIMWENVPGVLSSRDEKSGTSAFGCLLAELIGADAPIEPVGGRWKGAGVAAGPKRTAAWRTLDAQYVRVDGYPGAVPQRRRRVFVVACPGGGADPATVLFEPEGVRRHSAPRRETGEGVTPTLSARTKGGGGLGTDTELDGGLLADSEPQNIEQGVPNREGLSEVSRPLLGKENSSHEESQETYVPEIVGTLTAKGPTANGAPEVDAGFYIPEVVGALTDGAHNGGGLNGQDAYSGRIFPVAIHDKATRSRGGGEGRADDGAGNGLGVSDTGEMYTLTSGDKHAVCYENHPQDSRIKEHGDLSPALTAKAGTGGGNLPLVLEGSEPQNIEQGMLNAEVVATSQYGALAGTLAARHDSSPCADRGQNVVAFSCKDNGRDCVEGVAPTLRAMGAGGSHANGGGQLAVVAFKPGSSAAARSIGAQEGVACTLEGGGGGNNKQAVAFAGNTRDAGREMQVRRLTPRECERLQGFPDGYTQIPWVRKVNPKKLAIDFLKYAAREHDVPIEQVLADYAMGEYDESVEMALRKFQCPDGPRYKALGNSWAVNCARWIGMRIELVENFNP